MNKLKIITDGSIEGSLVYDDVGNFLGQVGSLEIKPKPKDYITVIQVGDDTARPTPTELEHFRQVFGRSQAR